MTEEQIEKAVKQGIETLRPKAISTAKEVANTMLDAYNQGFWDACGIVINSLWHEASEEPELHKPILLLMRSGNAVVASIIESNHSFNNGEKWLYIESLLPKGEKQ